MASRPRRTVFFVMLFVLSLIAGLFAGVIVGCLKSAPTLDQVEFQPEMTTYIYDVNGDPISQFYTKNRIVVSLERIPVALQQAVIAAEDDEFWYHHGIGSIKHILRAVYVNIMSGDLSRQGASTITQQLAGNAFTGRVAQMGEATTAQKLARKLKEALWAIQIERKYSKEEILEHYLNWIYIGPGAYGVQAGAQLYFGKNVWELALSESALLAALIRSPGYYSPFKHLDRAIRRRDWILERMHELGMISEEEMEKAQAETPSIVLQPKGSEAAPYFADYVRALLIERFGWQKVYEGGLRVYTTLDVKLNQIAAKALLEALPDGTTNEEGLSQPQGALVALEPSTGYIRAMVGGRGEDGDEFNRAIQAKRQPGSAFKVFAYTAAIDRGMTPATTFIDEPLTVETATGELYSPENWDHNYRGLVTLRTALEDSINVVAVRLAEQIGVRTIIDYAKRMGITTLQERGVRNDLGIATVLGGLTNGVTPLEMAQAFAVLANGGVRVEPTAILKVTDSYGRLLYESEPQKTPVLSEQTAYVMTDMLWGVIERGTGRRAHIGRPAAGKTGTTQNYTNAWFVGYTPQLAAAVYIGCDVPEPMVYGNDSITSGDAAAVWGRFMRFALEGKPVMGFTKPEGILDGIKVDITTGKLATEYCPSEYVRTEIFVDGTQPTTECDQHRPPSAVEQLQKRFQWFRDLLRWDSEDEQKAPQGAQ